MKRPEIIPAILPKDFSEIEEKVGLVKDFVKTIQIDVCDGQFTPQPSWPYKKTDDSFDKILKEEIGISGWDKVNFEIDMMVNSPESLVEDWVIAGASRIIIHIESKGNIFEAFDKLQDRVEIGLAINLDTTIEEIEKYKNKIQVVQCMGISHIGFQGEEFDRKVIDKILAIRKKYPDLVISCDGGVNLDNAQDLINAGANRLIVGSAIFDSDNFLESLQKLKKMK